MAFQATTGHAWGLKRVALAVASVVAVVLTFYILSILPVASLRAFVMDDQKITVTENPSSR